jgi:hypothetical protein
LKNRYNLFGFYGYPSEVAEKADYYADEAFGEKSYIRRTPARCSLYDYALTNVDVAAAQIAAAGKRAFTRQFIEPAQVERAGESKGTEKIFDQLPSAGSDRGYSLSGAMALLTSDGGFQATVGAAAGKAAQAYLENQYIKAYFKDRSDDKGLGPTYLQQEIEYIICGKHSDEANASSIRRKILSVREGMNLLYLSRDPEKNAEAMAMAELLTPGPAAAATQKVLLAGWALAESVNDYKLLIAGHRVASMKDSRTWAVDLASVVENRESDCIYTGVDEGANYGEYLSLFTYTMDARVRVLRILDLVQINMRYLYYDSFLLREYNGGVRFSIEINGRNHEVEKIY